MTATARERQTTDESTPEAPAEAAPSGPVADLRRLPRTVWRFLVEFVTINLVEPVQEGRLRLRGRDAPLRAIVWLSLLAYGAAVVLVVAGGALRARMELTSPGGGVSDLALPRSLLWLVVSLLALTLTLAQTGALHASPRLRPIAVAASSLALLLVGTTDSAVRGSTISPGSVTAFAAVGVIVTLQVVRWRRDPVWWEFVAVLGCVGATFVVSFAGARAAAVEFGSDIAPLNTTLLITVMSTLAVPLTVAAGVAVAEVGLSAVSWAGTFVQQAVSTTTLSILFVAAFAIRARDSVSGLDGETLTACIGAGALAVGIVALWLILDRVADRSTTTAPDDAGSSTVDHLTDALSSVALPVAVAVTFVYLPFTAVRVLAQVVFALWPGADATTRLVDVADVLAGDRALLVTRVLAGLAMIGAALRLATLGRRGSAELVGIIGFVLLVDQSMRSGAVLERWAWSLSAMDVIGIATVGVLTVVLAVRRCLRGHLGELLVLVAVTSLLTTRDFVSDPLAALLGFAGVAFVLFGFVWTFLTEAGPTNEPSASGVRDSRLLSFMARSLFGVTLLGWAAIVRSTDQGGDLEPFSALGDSVLGVPLLLAGFVALAADLLRRTTAHADGADHG